MVAARNVLLDCRLLLPADLGRQCDAFFDTVFQGQTHLAYAQNRNVPDGFQRAEFWDKARDTAYRDVPRLLEDIEKAARAIIHAEQA